MKKLLTMAACVLLVLGTAAFSAEKRIAVPLGESPSMGPENAPVTIVEFIDFQ